MSNSPNQMLWNSCALLGTSSLQSIPQERLTTMFPHVFELVHNSEQVHLQSGGVISWAQEAKVMPWNSCALHGTSSQQSIPQEHLNTIFAHVSGLVHNSERVHLESGGVISCEQFAKSDAVELLCTAWDQFPAINSPGTPHHNFCSRFRTGPQF